MTLKPCPAHQKYLSKRPASKAPTVPKPQRKKAPRQRPVPIDRIPVKEFLTRFLADGCTIRTTQHIVRKD